MIVSTQGGMLFTIIHLLHQMMFLQRETKILLVQVNNSFYNSDSATQNKNENPINPQNIEIRPFETETTRNNANGLPYPTKVCCPFC